MRRNVSWFIPLPPRIVKSLRRRGQYAPLRVRASSSGGHAGCCPCPEPGRRGKGDGDLEEEVATEGPGRPGKPCLSLKRHQAQAKTARSAGGDGTAMPPPSAGRSRAGACRERAWSDGSGSSGRKERRTAIVDRAETDVRSPARLPICPARQERSSPQAGTACLSAEAMDREGREGEGRL